MKGTKLNNLQEGLTTAYMDYTSSSSLAYRPEFVYNDYRQGKKVLSSLEQELHNCDEFFISVAFITKSGVTPFLMLLKELERRGIQGKILTTDYLTFSEPHALELLAGFSNIELKMFRTNDETGGFHTKGYIFREDKIYRIIIGSSNMTLSAVTKNREWNTKLVSTAEGQIAIDVLGEFQNLWESENSMSYEQFIDAYREEYLKKQLIKKQQRQAASEQLVELER